MDGNGLSTADRETPGCSNASQASTNQPTIQGQLQVMQNNILSALTEKLNQLIEANVENCLRRFNSAPASHNSNPDNRVRQPDTETWQGNHSNNSSFERNSGSLSSELSRRPDKVGPIMNGCKLKFSGTGLSVDNFIYQVDAMTNETLDGNFELMCKNVSSLFEGKAKDFFWRHHKTVRQINWESLCSALRKQYKDDRDDGDIEELIRQRKQENNESFDSFFNAINVFLDEMERPLSNSKLVRILRNNLRPEIRHEILNVDISCVSHLREVCRKRESFLEDVKRSHGYAKRVPFKKDVAELDEDFGTEEVSEVEINGEIEALNVVCWNCHKEGHI